MIRPFHGAWRASAFLIAAACAGCGDAFAPLGNGAPEDNPIDGAITPPAAETPQQTGDITLRFYDKDAGPAGEQLPSFEVHSGDFTQMEDEVWTFRKARATIYAADGEHIVIEAADAWMNYGTKSAVMKGGVVLTKGTMTMTLDELEWSDAERLARSAKPMTFRNGDTYMEAQSVVYYPDEERVTLTEAKGRLVNDRRPEE